MKNLVFCSACEQAALIRERQISATELISAHLAHIDRHNLRLNALVTLDRAGALERAAAADAATAQGRSWGPLHGVPMTAKDAFATSGVRTSFGVPFAKGQVPTYDATLVNRLKQAGAILLGKTNLPMLSFDNQSKNFTYGRTSNPWREACTVGGSSGGSAAALAAGFSALCVGSDIAGSIRMPAHYCGVVGLRPTEGSLSSFGHLDLPGLPRLGRSIAVCGPMARGVADLRLAHSVMWGADRNQWDVPPVRLDHVPCAESLRGLRVAWTDVLGPVLPTNDTRNLIKSLAARLEREGCIVTQDAPTSFVKSTDAALRAWGMIVGCDFQAGFPRIFDNFPSKWIAAQVVDQYIFRGGGFAAALKAGFCATFRSLATAMEFRDGVVQEVEAFFQNYDVLLSPVTAGPAFSHRKTGAKIERDDRSIKYTEEFESYSCPTALGGHPIVVLPMGLSQDGLPIGVQIHSRRWSDARLLGIAEMIEAVLDLDMRPAGL